MKNYNKTPNNNKQQNLIIAIMAIIIITLTTSNLEKLQLMNESNLENYNNGYRNGMLYAYDNVLVCNANPEREALQLTSKIKQIEGIEPGLIKCGE